MAAHAIPFLIKIIPFEKVSDYKAPKFDYEYTNNSGSVAKIAYTELNKEKEIVEATKQIERVVAGRKGDVKGRIAAFAAAGDILKKLKELKSKNEKDKKAINSEIAALPSSNSRLTAKKADQTKLETLLAEIENHRKNIILSILGLFYKMSNLADSDIPDELKSIKDIAATINGLSRTWGEFFTRKAGTKTVSKEPINATLSEEEFNIVESALLKLAGIKISNNSESTVNSSSAGATSANAANKNKKRNVSVPLPSAEQLAIDFDLTNLEPKTLEDAQAKIAAELAKKMKNKTRGKNDVRTLNQLLLMLQGLKMSANRKVFYAELQKKLGDIAAGSGAAVGSSSSSSSGKGSSAAIPNDNDLYYKKIKSTINITGKNTNGSPTSTPYNYHVIITGKELKSLNPVEQTGYELFTSFNTNKVALVGKFAAPITGGSSTAEPYAGQLSIEGGTLSYQNQGKPDKDSTSPLIDTVLPTDSDFNLVNQEVVDSASVDSTNFKKGDPLLCVNDSVPGSDFYEPYIIENIYQIEKDKNYFCTSFRKDKSLQIIPLQKKFLKEGIVKKGTFQKNDVVKFIGGTKPSSPLSSVTIAKNFTTALEGKITDVITAASSTSGTPTPRPTFEIEVPAAASSSSASASSGSASSTKIKITDVKEEDIRGVVELIPRTPGSSSGPGTPDTYKLKTDDGSGTSTSRGGGRRKGHNRRPRQTKKKGKRQATKKPTRKSSKH